MKLVLDCSVALSWVLPDENSARADQVYLLLEDPKAQAWIPALWWYEMANGLATASRRKRLPSGDARRALALMAMLPLRVDAALGAEVAKRWYTLSSLQGLSAYDAAYLELAERKGLALATLDGPLSKVARQRNIEVIGSDPEPTTCPP